MLILLKVFDADYWEYTCPTGRDSNLTISINFSGNVDRSPLVKEYIMEAYPNWIVKENRDWSLTFIKTNVVCKNYFHKERR